MQGEPVRSSRARAAAGGFPFADPSLAISSFINGINIYIFPQQFHTFYGWAGHHIFHRDSRCKQVAGLPVWQAAAVMAHHLYEAQQPARSLANASPTAF